jgi:1,2-phenylacetyl-CoA epoxidase PaaB subunit
MDPNTEHQQWSEWRFYIESDRPLPFQLIKSNFARFFRKLFGTAGQVNVTRGRTPTGLVWWMIQAQVEAANVNDPGKRTWVQSQAAGFVQQGMGPQARLTMEVSLLAGRPENGQPANQWLIMPSVIEPNVMYGVKPAVRSVSVLRPAAQRMGMAAMPSGAHMWGQ